VDSAGKGNAFCYYRRVSIDQWQRVFADIEAGKAIKALFIPEGE
jgi:hypothetical protein